MAMILSAFVPSLMRILSEMAQDEVGQLLGVPHEVDKLTRMVHQIQGVLIDAERRQTESEAINRWVAQLKDIMYDADDVIDLCRIKTNEQREKSGSSSLSKTSWGIHFLSCFRNPVFAREIATKIKELNLRIKAIASEIGFLGLLENRGASSEARQIATNINRKTHPLVILSDIVGQNIKEDTMQLVELLTKDGTEEQGNISIVAIVGMGGIGKTTLAKRVYNDPRIKAEFKLLIWICVSKELRAVDLLKNVIREVGGDCGPAQEISELMPKLEEYIRGKMFFLVLDDIWAECSEIVWDDHLRLPMSSGAPGSKVLITTRDGRVAKQMRAIHTLKVRRLSNEDGWSLLSKQVAQNGVENEIQGLKDIGIQIVNKCDGFPLAIKSIGGVLRTKDNTRGNWQAVLRSNVWSMDELPVDIHHAFYLSYENLSPALKQCFIYCSLFPEDFVFYKTNLIYRWLAEGFLQDKGDFWELGNEYYMELLLRNFLEDTEEYHGEEQSKMHDLLWSFAHHLGKDENYILRKRQVSLMPEGLFKVRRLSIEGIKVHNEIIMREKWLRTILLRGKPIVALDDLCKSVTKLRILDLSKSNISSLPDSLFNLVHLRYLDVSDSKLKIIPNSIGNLRNIVYFCCSGSKELSCVPQSISNLRELRYLNFHNTKVKTIPAGLKNLEKLIELCSFKPYQNNLEGFSSLDELGALSQLVTLQLVCLERVSDINIAKKANLRSKDRLQTLYLEYTSLAYTDEVFYTNEKKTTMDVLNELSPPSSLEVLKIEHYFGNHLPNWLNFWKALPNLRCVEIIDCACFDMLAPLGQLPNLDLLLVKGAYSVVSVGKEFIQGDTKNRDPTVHGMNCHVIPAFPKLNKLRFQGMRSWKNWHWNKREPAMPKLKKLFIIDCPQLRSLPEGLLHHATSLEYLEIDSANKLISIENFPSIKRLGVVRNPILERISNLPSISNILIKECPNLKAVENLKALQTMALIDYRMNILPDYLTTTMPQKLKVRCKESLLLKITSQRESGSEWNKFKHISKVAIYSPGELLYATYQKTPFRFTVDRSRRSVYRDDITALYSLLHLV